MMIKHGQKAKTKWQLCLFASISGCLLLISLILNQTLFNSSRAADQISRATVSTNITKQINRNLSPLTDNQIQIPVKMVQELVHTKVEQAYTTGKIEINQQDVQPQVSALLKHKLSDAMIGNWLSNQLAQQASPRLVKRLNQQLVTAADQRMAKQVYQARQFNQRLMWIMVGLNILLGAILIFTTNVWQLLGMWLLMLGSGLLIFGLGLIIGIRWYLANEWHQPNSWLTGIDPLFQLAKLQIGWLGIGLVAMGSLGWWIQRNIKRR